jgi:hypothetical protein
MFEEFLNFYRSVTRPQFDEDPDDPTHRQPFDQVLQHLPIEERRPD